MIPLSSQTLMMNLHHGQTQEYVIKPKYYPVKKVISGEQSTEGSLPLRLGQDQPASPLRCEYKKHIPFSPPTKPPLPASFKILKFSAVTLEDRERLKQLYVGFLRLANGPVFCILCRNKTDFLDEKNN